MTLTIVIAGSIFIIATIHHIIEETKKCENQKKMLKNIEALLREIWKIHYIVDKFGQINSFITYLENTTTRLYHDHMSEKEFKNYKNEFKNTIQNEYQTLLSEIIFVNPNIKKMLNSEYFGIIR